MGEIKGNKAFARSVTVCAGVALAAAAMPGMADAAPSGAITRNGNEVIFTLAGDAAFEDFCNAGLWATNDPDADAVSYVSVLGNSNAVVAFSVPAGQYFTGWECGNAVTTLTPVTVTGKPAVGTAPVGASTTQSGNDVTIHTHSSTAHPVQCTVGVLTKNLPPQGSHDFERGAEATARSTVGYVDVTWALADGNYFGYWQCLDLATSDPVGAVSLPPSATPIAVPAAASGGTGGSSGSSGSSGSAGSWSSLGSLGSGSSGFGS